MSIVGFEKILLYAFIFRTFFFPGFNNPREIFSICGNTDFYTDYYQYLVIC